MKIVSAERTVLDKYAAGIITETASRSDKAIITIALPGGRSVNGIFQQLLEQDINWQKIHIFLTDERIVPLNSTFSNFRLLEENLFLKLTERDKLPQNNIHAFHTDCNNIEFSLKNYSRELQNLGGSFDIILLSAGEDGHIASLFPDHNSVRSDLDNYILVEDSPKPPDRRISISRDLLLRSNTAVLLFYGKAKSAAWENFLNDQIKPVSCPAKLISQIEDSYILTDQELPEGR